MDSMIQFGLGPAFVLLVGWLLDRRQGRRMRVVGAKVDETNTATEVVRQQVQNSHQSNLRDDLDMIMSQQRAHHAEFRAFKGDALDRLRSVETKTDDQRRAQEHLAERFDAHLDRRGKFERSGD